MSMTIAELRPALLLAMLEAHNAILDDEEDFQFDLIDDVFLKYDLDAKKRSVELCAKEFRDQGLIEIEKLSGSEDESYYRCSMTATGIDRAEQLIAAQLNRPEEQRDEMIAVGATLESSASNNAPPVSGGGFGSQPFGAGPFGDPPNIPPQTVEPSLGGDVPASNRTVPLNHNSPEYRDVTKNLADLIIAIETNRKNDFKEREQCLSELRAASELLKSTAVNPSKIQLVLFSCLTFIASTFANEPIGDLAHLTWTSIKTLLGH